MVDILHRFKISEVGSASITHTHTHTHEYIQLLYWIHYTEYFCIPGQIAKHVIVQYSPSSCYFVYVCADIHVSIFCSNILDLHSHRNVVN
jgi:hypothetical protein